MQPVNLISPQEYITLASQAIRTATTRVYLLSMVLANHENTKELISALEEAAARGVTVVVAADVFTYGEVSGGFLPVRYYSKGTKETKLMTKAFKKSGVRFSWLGRNRATIFNGRTHNKWCIVDNTIFSFGGVNLYDNGIKNTDYMLSLVDETLADRLVAEQKRIQTAERRAANYSSVAYEHNGDTILFDGGIIGQSVIYRRACELAEEATSITFVSQYCPTGRLARILKRKPTVLYYNRPSQAPGLNKAAIAVSQFFSGLKTSYSRVSYLHAKCIIFTMADGSKVALSGSHNFAYTGVLLGTREVALETKKPNIIAQLESFIANSVA